MSRKTMHAAEYIADAASRYFQLEKFGSSIRTEIIAGITVFLSISYVFLVSPAILSQAGIDPKAVLLATAISASVATLAMGLWANLPFIVAPGLTMSTYFAFVVVQKMQFSWQQGLAAVCVSGAICVAMTLLPVRQAIIDSIPEGLKRAITVSIGVFVITIGLFISNMLVFSPSGFIDFTALDAAHLLSPLALVMAAGLCICAILGLPRLKFPAGMMAAIILAALLHHMLLPPKEVVMAENGKMFSAMGQMDFSVFTHSQFWLPVLVFFVLDFFEGIGEFIGITSNTSIQDKDGNVPNVKEALGIDGLGTMLGAWLGTSSLIVFVESAVGIRAGGRTGLTAVVCSLLMALVAWLGFYYHAVLAFFPAQAASGVLVYVGYLILSSAMHRGNKAARFDYLVGLGMGAISLLTFSLDKSLALGMWAYFGASLMPGSGRKPAWWLAAIAGALTVAIIWSR